MEHLQTALSVLSRSIHYKNLTGASLHIGLSQPQISRYISQIEQDLEIQLLDRSSKRHSSWTESAFELAKIYDDSSRRLKHSLQDLQTKSMPTQLYVGSLEGLAWLATDFCKMVLDHTTVNYVQLDVYDQDVIESKFLNGDIEIALTSRVPSKQKLKYFLHLGKQTFTHAKTNSDYEVFSTFEYQQKKTKERSGRQKTIVSNSLLVKRSWLEKYGGCGQLPGPFEQDSTTGSRSVLLLGTDSLNSTVWQQTENLLKHIRGSEPLTTSHQSLNSQ